MPETRRPLTSHLLQPVILRARAGTTTYRIVDRLQRIAERRALSRPLRSRPMVRLHGELRVVVDEPRTDHHDAVRRNAEHVASAVAGLGLEHFVVDAPFAGRVRLGVVAGSLRGLAETIAREHPDGYLQFRDPERGPRVELADAVDVRDLEHVDSLTFFHYLRFEVGAPPFDSAQGCVVDRWERDEEGLTSPVENAIATDVPQSEARPATVFVGDRELPTLEPFTGPRLGDVTFPVDAVYMWVDGDDPAWRRRRDEALRAAGRDGDTNGGARFRQHDELRYSLRSLEHYAPWVRHVYLVTDQQRPEWLADDHERLTVVDHRDIFADPGVLPTFNSHAIGSQLHHIDGLADHYLVFNDDVLLGRPVPPYLFFDANGVSKYFLSMATVPAGPVRPDDLPHEAARKRARDLVAERYGQAPTRTFRHTPIPQVRSVNELLESRHPEVFETTSASRFRSTGDVETVGWLHHYTGFFERWARPGGINYNYFAIGDRSDLELMERRLGHRRPDCLCVNDVDWGEATAEERARQLSRFLGRLMPTPSSFERG